MVTRAKASRTPYQKNEDMPPTDLRFRGRPGSNWEPGWFRAWNDDGSIELISQRQRAARSIASDRVEFKGRGPRGGEVWEQAIRPIPDCAQ